MNEEACTAGPERRPSATFPDIPPADLCRRHSCLDNFVLSACVAKASDNLTRLDEVLRRQRLTDTVKRSYRAAVARARPSASAGRHGTGGRSGGGGGGGDALEAVEECDESRSARRLARQATLLVDARPPSGRLAQDVHGLLENLGTLLRRLERDIHKTWARIQDIEAASRAVQGDMRRTSEGCSHKLEQRIQTLWSDWHVEQATLTEEREQAQQQAVSMAASIAALQQRVGVVGQYVENVREQAASVGDEARQEFAELRELKERVRVLTRERRREARRSAQLRQILQQQQSEGEIRTMQRVVRRRTISEKLQVSRRDATATTSTLQLVQRELAVAESEANSREVQVSSSLTELSRLSHRELPALDEDDPARSVDQVCVTVRDAMTQAVARLAHVRSRQMQTELACRDCALQISQMARTEEVMGQEQESLEIEIDGVKISKLCSSKQIRQNVNMLTTRSILTRKKVQETITRWQEAQRAAETVQPEIYEIQGDIRDIEVKLKAVVNKQEPILAKLTALRRKFQEEEEEERRRIELAKGEVTYQGRMREELEAKLLATQNMLRRELDRYEMTLAELETLEDTFATNMATAKPMLEKLMYENVVALRTLADVSRERSDADHFIDDHGAALMTQKVALAFAAQVQEAEMFECGQHVRRLSVALEQSRREEASHVELIAQLTPRRDELAEEIECLDSELRWRRGSHGTQLDRLRQLAELVADWEQQRSRQLERHEQHQRQARLKTDTLSAEYRRGVTQNAELRAEYGALVERWLGARMRTAIRFLPQITVRADLCGQLQVVRLVRTGVYATDRTLGLRHLYYSGEHQRGESRLAELYSTVRVMRADIALASEHVVRMFIGLMKGDVPFVRRTERETDLRDGEMQTDAKPPEDAGDRAREERERRQRQRELVMRVAEMGRAETADRGLPPVGKHGEKPVRGMGKLRNKDSKLRSQTPRLPKI